MKMSKELYGQFLLSSQINYTCTYLADHFAGLPHDNVNYYLSTDDIRPRQVWQAIRHAFVASKEGYLLFDDTVLSSLEKYTKHLADPAIHMRTIKANDEIVGSIAKFVMENEAGITYWIDRKFWGQGIATTALKAFLKIEQTRPIYGRVAFDNDGSQKVLAKCGFVKIGTDKGFANARQIEIEEFIYKLSD